MGRILFFVFMFAALLGCRPSGNRPDSGEIIPRDSMILVMADVELTEAALRYQQTRISRDSLEKVKTRSYDSLYLYYKLTPERFNQNLVYYQNDLADFENMLDEVMLSLTKDKDSLVNKSGKPVDSATTVVKMN
jgi:hypothetical protein